MFYSKFALSVATILLSANVILHPNGLTHVKKVAKKKSWRIFWAILLIYGITIIYSEDLSIAFFMGIQMKLPFLFLPIVFLSTPGVTKHDLRNILFFFVIVTTLVSIHSFIYYLIHFKEITNELGKGGSFPLPIQHPRFGLLLAISIFSAIYLHTKNHFWRFNWEKIVLKCCIVLLFAFLHIVAIRSGLFCFYLAALTIVILSLLKNRRKKRSWLMLAAIITIPILAYFVIPSLQKKVQYTKYDLEMLINGKYSEMPLSDSDRITSILAGIETIKKYPIIGVGIGDLRKASEASYQKNFANSVERAKMPHNQFVFVAAFSGIIGLLIFCCVVAYPLMRKKIYTHFLQLGIVLIFLASFLVEYTLETQLGVTMFVFFSVLSMRMTEFDLEEK